MKKHQLLRLIILVAILSVAACKEEDGSTFETSTEDLKAALTSATWTVDLFFDGDNKTDQFKHFVFTFLEDGTVSVSSGMQGAWSVNGYGRSGSKLSLAFDESTGTASLTDEWKTVEISESFLRFEDVGGGPGEITQVNKLTFKKSQ